MESTYLRAGCNTSSFPKLAIIRSCNTHARGVVSFSFHPQIKPFRTSLHRSSAVIPAATVDGGDSNPIEEESTAGGDHGSEAPGYTLPQIPNWMKWLVGGLLWLSLSASKKLQEFGDYLKSFDKVVEVIRDVADKADEVAEDIGENLPKGRFKDFMENVEKVSEAIESGATALDKTVDRVTDAIDKMRENDEKDGKK